MDSASLANGGFVLWLPFNLSGERRLLEQTPQRFGAYVVRRRIPYPRAVGESDVMYIGVAANEKGLQQRLRQYFHPGATQRTSKRILAIVGNSDQYEVAWVCTESRAKAKILEAELLEEYERQHRSLPPENLRR